jgi:hypothetical protein
MRDDLPGRLRRPYTHAVGASVTLVAPAVAVQPGGTATVELRLRNTGSVVDEFSFDVLGEAAGWAAVEPPTLSLFPGAEGNATVVFSPPRTATTPAGQIPFGVRARSREDAAGSAVEEGTIDVAPFLEPFAELVPRTARGSGGTGYDLAVDNRGNVRLNALVEASDDDRQLRFDVQPPAVVVEPGMAGFSKVKVTPAKRFWRGQPKTRPFRLAVQPEGHPPLLLDGTLLQESILPPWFMKAMLLLVGALIALVILWLFVLKPSIESAAAAAVEEPIAALTDDINDAFEAAGLPPLDGGGGGGAPTPAPGEPTPDPGAPTGDPGAPTPTPATGGGPFVPGLGNLVDGRLDQARTTVPVTGTLFITDFVFSNPNGRSGAIVVLRNDQPLFQLRLENFRDLDFHFVTPIVLVNGDSLNLSLACTDGAQCDPAVLYSGYARP